MSPENRSDVPPGPKPIGGEGRRNAVGPSVTHDKNERSNGQNPYRRDSVVRPKKDHLGEVHQKIGHLAIGDVGNPGPKNAAEPIADANDAHKPRRCGCVVALPIS